MFGMKRSLAPPVCVLALVLTSCTWAPEPRRTAEDYDRAIRLGAEWFLNNQNERFLHYSYHVEEDRYIDERSPVREMATLWVVAMAANYLDDPRLRDLAQRGFAYFETFLVEEPEGEYLYVNITPDGIALAYSAFAILALLELEHPQRERYLERLADGILSLQERSGKYRTFFFSDLDTNQDYFPGEACLALMSLYEETGDERILASVKRAFLYYKGYWDGHHRAAFASWQIQAQERLHTATRFERVRAFVFEMADWVIRYHRPDENCRGFRLNGVFVASRIEGLNRAYKLARDIGHELRTDCYGRFVRDASDYLLDIQLADRSAYPEAAIGGFPADKEPRLRIDRNQHALAALIEARRLGLLD